MPYKIYKLWCYPWMHVCVHWVEGPSRPLERSRWAMYVQAMYAEMVKHVFYKWGILVLAIHELHNELVSVVPIIVHHLSQSVHVWSLQINFNSLETGSIVLDTKDRKYSKMYVVKKKKKVCGNPHYTQWFREWIYYIHTYKYTYVYMYTYVWCIHTYM